MLELAIDTLGDGSVLLLAGLCTGLLFGAAAQHSKFCLRAATVEFWSRNIGPRTGIWLIVFCTALLLTQGMIALGVLDVSNARQLAATGSISGAVIGGFLFGSGMILARGCASRLLVLSATGNLRALVTGLVLTLTAQASLRGILSPFREQLTGLWIVEGGAARNLLNWVGTDRWAIIAVAALGLAMAVMRTRRQGIPATEAFAALLVGAAVAFGWWATFAISETSFEPVAVSSVTFTGPSTDTLMALINERSVALSFSLGLIPGVFIGSFAMSIATGSFEIQRFNAEGGMERYLVGATLMGFGSMLAGGCAVGAGVSGGAVMAMTAWLALTFMWIGAVFTQSVLAARAPSGRVA